MNYTEKEHIRIKARQQREKMQYYKEYMKNKTKCRNIHSNLKNNPTSTFINNNNYTLPDYSNMLLEGVVPLEYVKINRSFNFGVKERL